MTAATIGAALAARTTRLGHDADTMLAMARARYDFVDETELEQMAHGTTYERLLRLWILLITAVSNERVAS